MIEGKKTASPFQWITFTYQFNMTGQPAATVPADRGLRGCCAMERQVAAHAQLIRVNV